MRKLHLIDKILSGMLKRDSLTWLQKSRYTEVGHAFIEAVFFCRGCAVCRHSDAVSVCRHGEADGTDGIGADIRAQHRHSCSITGSDGGTFVPHAHVHGPDIGDDSCQVRSGKAKSFAIDTSHVSRGRIFLVDAGSFDRMHHCF